MFLVDVDDLLEGSRHDLARARYSLAIGDPVKADELAAADIARVEGTDLHTTLARACTMRADAAGARGLPQAEETWRTRAVLLHLRGNHTPGALEQAALLPISLDDPSNADRVGVEPNSLENLSIRPTESTT